ncbi:MAG TPA: ABC transporter ATP-binding protein [Ktedonobacteraceae bacterium]|nr:ABC transporter ATP-binding protein [Ktedonobacteraceae bacterium]
MESRNEIVVVENVEKRYQQRGITPPALRNISLSIARGEFVSLIGRSGSGKSTLLHLLAGIDVPSQGTILVNGKNLADMGETQRAKFRRREIGIVFQSFNLLGNLTVLQNVMLPGSLVTRSRQQVREHAQQLLADLGIAHLEQRLPAELSGGQQQRVAIARALINTPSLLLADEPTGNLDSQTGEEVLKLFEKYHAQGQTIVLVTHDRDIAGRASRLITIADGQIVGPASPPPPPPAALHSQMTNPR